MVGVAFVVSTSLSAMSSTPGQGPAWGMTPATDQEPDELEAGPVIEPHTLPRWIWAVLGMLLVLLAVGGAVFAAMSINNRPSATASPSQVNTQWSMTPPLTMGAYSRDANAVATPSSNPATQKQALATTYSKNGKDMLVLLQSRPEDDARKFMTDLGMNAIVENGNGFCGTSIESNRDACAIVRGNTAVAVSDLAGLTRTELMKLAEQFADQLEKG